MERDEKEKVGERVENQEIRTRREGNKKIIE